MSVNMEFNKRVNASPKDFYNNGMAFMEAAWRCFGNKQGNTYHLIDGGKIYTLPGPTVVNAAFACEMFFKALLKHYNIKYDKVHDLYRLYKLLPQNSQNSISAFCGDKEDISVFDRILAEQANDFEEIRYYVEKAGWTGMKPLLMITLAYNLSQITNILMQDNYM